MDNQHSTVFKIFKFVLKYSLPDFAERIVLAVATALLVVETWLNVVTAVVRLGSGRLVAEEEAHQVDFLVVLTPRVLHLLLDSNWIPGMAMSV